MRITCTISRQTGFLSVIVLSLLCTSLTSAAASYKVTILTSDQTGAPFLDSNLQNPWGLTYSPTGPFWVSDNKSGVSTIYTGTGAPNALVVTIPPSACCGSTKGSPTGVVFNGSALDFQGAHFIFATEDGMISAWTGGITAAIAVDKSRSPYLANYKGLELVNNGSSLLYVADFHNGRIEVFDTNFAEVTFGGGFIDPNIPAGYAPFNIALINGRLFVTYAKQNATKTDAVFCAGCGFVDSFDLNGTLIKRFASKGHLNAPWGLAVAPGNFGTFSGDVLIGNLGDGKINAYKSGVFLGQLLNSASTPIVIKKLWGLKFGNDGNAGLKKELFFTAGPGTYLHGRFGKITFQ